MQPAVLRSAVNALLAFLRLAVISNACLLHFPGPCTLPPFFCAPPSSNSYTEHGSMRCPLPLAPTIAATAGRGDAALQRQMVGGWAGRHHSMRVCCPVHLQGLCARCMVLGVTVFHPQLAVPPCPWTQTCPLPGICGAGEA